MSILTRFKSRNESGQNLVELGLVLPFLIVLFGILFDLGRGFNAYIVITNAAREAARVGSASGTTTAIQQEALGEITRGGLNQSLAQVSVVKDDGNVRVTVTYQFPLIGAMIFSGQPVQLRRTVNMVIL